MGAFINRLQPAFKTMLKYFDERVMLQKCASVRQGAVSEIDSAIVEQVAVALKRPGFLLKAHTLRCVAAALGAHGRWAEGCPCHEPALRGPGHSQERRNRFALESAQCVWKGCRGVELALGHVERMQTAVAGASGDLLAEVVVSVRSGPEFREARSSV